MTSWDERIFIILSKTFRFRWRGVGLWLPVEEDDVVDPVAFDGTGEETPV